jgi:hypothetical protein
MYVAVCADGLPPVSPSSPPLPGNVFGEQKTMKEQIREQKRMVERSVRGLERDRASLERDEKKLILDIKKQAKAGQMKSVKIMAKDLVRIRKHQEKFVNLTAQLRAISLQMTVSTNTTQRRAVQRRGCLLLRCVRQVLTVELLFRCVSSPWRRRTRSPTA